MIHVRGKIERGKILALEPIDDKYEGREVQITFVENGKGTEQHPGDSAIDDGWQELMDGIERNRINTGIGDLAHQHDHYLYGTPKRD